MKNLSEKLNYCNTSILEEQYKEHLFSCENYKKKYPQIQPSIWQSPESPYYVSLLTIKQKQDANEIVTDEEYASIPVGGVAFWNSPAEGFYLVNFHYNFFNPNYSGKLDLIYKFMDFLTEIDFIKCTNSAVSNWKADFNYFVNNILGSQIKMPGIEEKCKFILDILQAIDPTKNNGVGSLMNVDRSVDPDIFDNAVKYFRSKKSNLELLRYKYADYISFKAKDVMEILNITRQTLSNYVKQGLIVINSNINGKYTYDKESVFALLEE